jgi:hypothetical protein
MIKKILLLVFVVFLILALTGCGPHFLDGLEDADCAEQTVWDYWQAIINRQYELTKGYCVIGGVWDHKTDEWEEYININSEGEASVVIYQPSFYEQPEAIENNAVVYVRIAVSIIPFPDSCIIGGDTFEYETELIKQNYPPGDWELK